MIPTILTMLCMSEPTFVEDVYLAQYEALLAALYQKQTEDNTSFKANGAVKKKHGSNTMTENKKSTSTDRERDTAIYHKRVKKSGQSSSSCLFIQLLKKKKKLSLLPWACWV